MPERLRQILTLGLPIIGGMLSQSLINLVDAAMVGHLGETALAGVGIGSYANFMVIALVMGLGSGVQALVARRRGEGRLAEVASPLNAGLLLALLVGLPLGLLCWWAAPWIIDLLADDPAVAAIGQDYFQWRVLAVAAVGLNFAFRGFWNGSHRSGMYMRILLGMHLANAALREGIRTIPGALCSALPQFDAYLRLSCGAVTPEGIDEGVATLARLARGLAVRKSPLRSATAPVSPAPLLE